MSFDLVRHFEIDESKGIEKELIICLLLYDFEVCNARREDKVE
jgi:hypothetical protein